MAKDIGDKAKEGMFWTAFFEFVEFGLRFGSSIILARILFPEDFGLMGMASIAIQFARRLTNFGLTSVLVQLKEIKEDHYHTVYWMNLGLMTIVATIVFFSAPYYSALFQEERLRLIMQVVAFDFILKAFASVPQAVLRRRLKFRQLGMAHTIGKAATIFSTVAMAVAGWGVWSLVLGTLFGSFCQRSATIRFALKYSPWKPKFRFKLWALKDTFSFGLWLYVNTYITYGINKVDYFFIGKFLGAAALGFYERAFDLMSLPRKRLVRKINTVAFSTYSRIQDDDMRLVRGLLRVTRYLSIITYPLMIWLYFVAPSLIVVLYGEKWALAVVPLQIMCISGLLDSFTLIFHPLLKAKGYIGHSTRRDFLYLAVLTGAVLIGIRWGIVGVSWGIVSASIIRLSLMVNLTVRRLPLTVWRFIAVQRSALVYGAIQVGLLLSLQWASQPYFSNTSIPMLLAVTAVSLFSFLGSHFLIRYQDINDVFLEFSGDIKKFARKLPVVNRLSFLHGKS